MLISDSSEAESYTYRFSSLLDLVNFCAGKQDQLNRPTFTSFYVRVIISDLGQCLTSYNHEGLTQTAEEVPCDNPNFAEYRLD
jgi:hypothetical protein